jgi:NAD-dependent dihydropyrimidine dehydrogenase PreA subunit
MMTWLGIPRGEIPWYPTIAAEKCTGCRTCVDFCPNDVLEFDEAIGKTIVRNPFNCVVECSTCGKLCPEGALRFPDEAVFSAFIKERIARQAMKG